MSELGSAGMSRVVGKPTGQMTIGAIVGLKSLGVDKALFDACNTGSTITLRATPSGCAGVGGSITYIFGGIAVVNVGGTIDADDYLIRRNLGLSYVFYNEIAG